MLTRKRITLPVLSGDWRVDGPNVLKAISDYLLSLEQKGALAITEAEISGTVGAGNLDLNGNDLIIDTDGDTYIHETADDVVRMVVGGSDSTVWNTTGFGVGVTPSYKLHVLNNLNPTSTSGAGALVLDGNYGGGLTFDDGNQCGIFVQDSGATLKIYVNKGGSDTPDGKAVVTLRADRIQFASGFHVTSATATGTTPALQSGTYTPTLSNTTNITSSTANADAKWFRVGNIVRVSCQVSVRPAGAGSCVLGVSLPIASNLAASTELSGVGVWSTTIVGSVTGDTTNDRATFTFTATADPGVEAPTQIEFSYEVL